MPWYNHVPDSGGDTVIEPVPSGLGDKLHSIVCGSGPGSVTPPIVLSLVLLIPTNEGRGSEDPTGLVGTRRRPTFGVWRGPRRPFRDPSVDRSEMSTGPGPRPPY